MKIVVVLLVFLGSTSLSFARTVNPEGEGPKACETNYNVYFGKKGFSIILEGNSAREFSESCREVMSSLKEQGATDVKGEELNIDKMCAPYASGACE